MPLQVAWYPTSAGQVRHSPDGERFHACSEPALPTATRLSLTFTSELRKWAISAVSSEASQPLTDFGPNEWLVEELYQKYLTDPNSVDKAWWNFFADYKPADTAGGKGGGTAAAKAQTEKAPTPAPKKKATTAPAPKSTDDALQVKEERLRGAPARTATNMESSLTMPTATSVRAVPVKLLFDNRIVINNHLRRSRGGKVSFTHLIGYAMVKALKAMPEMNHAYVEVDGKPGVAKPEHVNFGLAIDLPKPDGSRQLVVPSIKKSDEMDFNEFWSGYEDLVRKARNNKLGVTDFQGTTISLTNPALRWWATALTTPSR